MDCKTLMDDKRHRKSKEQRSWELRKLQMAGIEVDPKLIESVDEPLLNLTYRRNLFLNHKYYVSSTERIIKTNTEMFKIGNKESKFFDMHKNIGEYKDNYHFINCNSVKHESSAQTNYKDLPVYKLKEEFINFYSNNSIMVVTGETGCGKSTLVPKIIYDHFKHRIGITQPRRVAVKSLFERMKSWYKEEIGYSMKFDSCFNKNTKIKFMTEGILMKEIQSDSVLSKYDTVILDEAHERGVNMDILLGFLKVISEKRPNLKIIVMSATLNITKFVSFFNCESFTFNGKRFPVDVKYLQVNVDDYLEWTVKKIITLTQNKNDNGNILVFLSGKDDIDKSFKLLCHLLRDSFSHFLIVKCYSDILSDIYNFIFDENTAIRKIILSTNVSEASVTIPNIKYVIDTGFHKVVVHDYSMGDVLIKCPISKENAIQRAGRCGRTSSGICYRMYTRKTFDLEFEYFTPPEILRSNLSNILLLLVDLNIYDLTTLPLIDNPSYELVDSCYDFLILLQALDDTRKITNLGHLILDLGLDCISGKLIYEGIKLGCSYEMLILVSFITYETSYVINLLREVNTSHYNLVFHNNDFMTLINIYKNSSLVKREFRIICNKLIERFKNKCKFSIVSSGDINIISKAILKSLFFNLSKRLDNNFMNLISRSTFNIPKNTTIDNNVDYLVYYKTFKEKEKNFSYLSMKVLPKDVLKYLGNIFEDKNELSYTQKIDKPKFIVDDSNVYDNFELEFDENKKKKRKFVI